MTFATTENRETTSINPGRLKAFISAALSRINHHRVERKELRKLYSHHTANDAILAQAQRDVSRVWY